MNNQPDHYPQAQKHTDPIAAADIVRAITENTQQDQQYYTVKERHYFVTEDGSRKYTDVVAVKPLPDRLRTQEELFGMDPSKLPPPMLPLEVRVSADPPADRPEWLNGLISASEKQAKRDARYTRFMNRSADREAVNTGSNIADGSVGTAVERHTDAISPVRIDLPGTQLQQPIETPVTEPIPRPPDLQAEAVVPAVIACEPESHLHEPLGPFGTGFMPPDGEYSRQSDSNGHAAVVSRIYSGEIGETDAVGGFTAMVMRGSVTENSSIYRKHYMRLPPDPVTPKTIEYTSAPENKSVQPSGRAPIRPETNAPRLRNAHNRIRLIPEGDNLGEAVAATLAPAETTSVQSAAEAPELQVTLSKQLAKSSWESAEQLVAARNRYAEISAAARAGTDETRRSRVAQASRQIARLLGLQRNSGSHSYTANMNQARSEYAQAVDCHYSLGAYRAAGASLGADMHALQELSLFEEVELAARIEQAKRPPGLVGGLADLVGQQGAVGNLANTGVAVAQAGIGIAMSAASTRVFGDPNILKSAATTAIAAATGWIGGRILAREVSRSQILDEDVQEIERERSRALILSLSEAVIRGTLSSIDLTAIITTENQLVGDKTRDNNLRRKKFMAMTGAVAMGGAALATEIAAGNFAASSPHTAIGPHHPEATAVVRPSGHPDGGIGSLARGAGHAKPLAHWNHSGVNPDAASKPGTLWDFIGKWEKDPAKILNTIHRSISSWNHTHPRMQLGYMDHPNGNYWVEYKGSDGLWHSMNGAQGTALKQVAYNLPAA